MKAPKKDFNKDADNESLFDKSLGMEEDEEFERDVVEEDDEAIEDFDGPIDDLDNFDDFDNDDEEDDITF